MPPAVPTCVKSNFPLVLFHLFYKMAVKEIHTLLIWTIMTFKKPIHCIF